MFLNNDWTCMTGNAAWTLPSSKNFYNESQIPDGFLFVGVLVGFVNLTVQLELPRNMEPQLKNRLHHVGLWAHFLEEGLAHYELCHFSSGRFWVEQERELNGSLKARLYALFLHGFQVLSLSSCTVVPQCWTITPKLLLASTLSQQPKANWNSVGNILGKNWV